MAREISLPKGLTAIVDDEDYERLAARCWQVNGGGYARRIEVDPVTKRRRLVLMHREIMNCPKGMVVDHLNGDPMDNRRANLRVCSRSENAIDSGRKRPATGRWISMSDLATKCGVAFYELLALAEEGFIPVVDFRQRLLFPSTEFTPELRDRIAAEVARRIAARKPAPVAQEDAGARHALLTVEQAAERMDRCTTWVRKECVKGTIPGAFRVGKAWIIPEAALAAYVPGASGWQRGRPRKRNQQQPA